MLNEAERVQAERILFSHIEVSESGCWIWDASKNKWGYGRLKVGSRTDGSRRLVAAHRAAYEVWKGEIPEGLTVSHLCDTPPCINPLCLIVEGMWDNTRRSETSPTAVNARKTHCPEGHPLTPRKDGKGRECHPCKLAYFRKYNAKRRARKLGLL